MKVVTPHHSGGETSPEGLTHKDPFPVVKRPGCRSDHVTPLIPALVVLLTELLDYRKLCHNL